MQRLMFFRRIIREKFKKLNYDIPDVWDGKASIKNAKIITKILEK